MVHTMYLWVCIHTDVNMCVYFERKHLNALLLSLLLKVKRQRLTNEGSI